jgi:hypothetical protein
VVMQNGDQWHGEVNSLSKGKLKFDAIYLFDPIQLDWSKIVRLETTTLFRFQMENGMVYAGTIIVHPRSEHPEKNVEIRQSSGSVWVPQDNIIYMDSMKIKFISQLKGSVDLGLTYTKSNDTTQGNVNAELGYPGLQNTVDATYDSVLSFQKNGLDTSRQDLKLNYSRLLRNRNWFLSSLTEFLKSTQQDLNLRTTAGGGLGKYLLRTNRSRASVLGGAVYSHETYSVPQPEGTNPSSAEILLGAAYSTFRFNKTEFNTQLSMFPSMTVGGRVRLDFSADFRLQFTDKLYWRVSFYDNFDNKPPATAPGNDVGFSTSFGYSF